MNLDIEEVKLDKIVYEFFNKNTIIVGESGTGKSTIIKNMLYILNPYFDQAIAFSATNSQNNIYTDVIPPILIHEKLDMVILKNMWSRQENLTEILSVRKIEIIQSLLNLISEELPDVYVQKINNIKSSDYGEYFINHLVNRIYGDYILSNIDKLKDVELNYDQTLYLDTIKLNVNMLLILDDITEQIKKNSDTIKKIFYRGRWNCLTTLMALHTDKALDPEIKKNARNIIFTSHISLSTYFSKESSNVPADFVKELLEQSENIFKVKNQKILYSTSERKVFRFTADIVGNFKMCTKSIWELSEKITVNKMEKLKSNKLFGKSNQLNNNKKANKY